VKAVSIIQRMVVSGEQAMCIFVPAPLSVHSTLRGAGRANSTSMLGKAGSAELSRVMMSRPRPAWLAVTVASDAGTRQSPDRKSR